MGGQPFQLLARAGEVLLLVEEEQILLPSVAVEALQRRLELRLAGLQGAVPFLGQRELGFEAANGLLQLLDLAPPLQGAVPLALQRAAGDHPPGVEDLAVEGDQGTPHLLRLPQGQGIG